MFLSALSLVVVILCIGMVIINRLVNHIPPTGRDAYANGEKIVATITNNNKTADRSVTMRAKKDGRKFKVKIKATEANLWTKGDKIEILLSDNPKKYRVLFNDFFRNNENKIRETVIERLKKVDMYLVSKALTGYKKENYDEFKESKMETKRIFSFLTYMKMVDVYAVVTVVLAIIMLLWWKLTSPQTGELVVIGTLVLLVGWSVYSAVTACKRILKELKKTTEKEQQI